MSCVVSVELELYCIVGYVSKAENWWLAVVCPTLTVQRTPVFLCQCYMLYLS